MKQALLRTVVVLMLLAFAGIGIAHIFRPDLLHQALWCRRGGELLTESNRLGFQIAGAIFAGFAIYLIVRPFPNCTSFSDDERRSLGFNKLGFSYLFARLDQAAIMVRPVENHETGGNFTRLLSRLSTTPSTNRVSVNPPYDRFKPPQQSPEHLPL
jgi:hypothetical protein